MKIFMHCNLPGEKKVYTGADRRNVELILALSRYHKIILLADNRPEFLSERNLIHITERMDKLPGHTYNYSWFLAGWKNRKKIKKNKPDFAVAWGPLQAVFFRIYGIKNIVSCNREDLMGYSKIGKKGFSWIVSVIRAYVTEFLEVLCSRRIIVQCRSDREALIKRHRFIFKLTGHEVKIQINNVNPSWAASDRMSPTSGEAEKLEIQKKSGCVTIGFVTAFDCGGTEKVHRKGNHLLLPVIRRLVCEGYKIELLVAGSGAGLDEFIKAYKDCPAIKFAGYCNSTEIYRLSDLSVTPSLMDSCPNSLLEAIACGVPAYASRVGGMKDILRKRQYMFEPTQEGIYMFLKDLIKSKRYLGDQKEQDQIRDRLSFDWGEAMMRKITE